MPRPPQSASPCTSSTASNNLLSENPKLGAPGRVAGTRELVIPKTPYIVHFGLYGLDENEVAAISEHEHIPNGAAAALRARPNKLQNLRRWH